MFRYRCPQCKQVLQAPEIRAGKATVCPKCSQPITIPADPSLWLTEDGAPKPAAPAPPPPVVAVAAEPVPVPVIEPVPTVAVARLDDTLPLPAPKPPAVDDSWGPIPLGNGPAVEVRVPEVRVIDVTTEPDVKVVPPAAPTPPTELIVELPPPVPAPQPLPPPPVVIHTPPAPVVPPAPPRPSRPNITANTSPPPVAPPVSPAAPARSPSPVAAVVKSATPPTPSRPWPRQVATAPSPAPTAVARRGAADESVTFDDPLVLRSQLDYASELTMALTTRMKPPPVPPRDLPPSTAFWLLLTGLAVALVVLTLFTPADYLRWVVYLGIAQVIIGYAWIVTLVFRRDPAAGVACAVPPVTFWYLTRRRFRQYRPLRFVLSGAAVVLLWAAAQSAAPHTRELVGANDRPEVVPPTDLATQPAIVRLRAYRDERQVEKLIELLHELAQTDREFSRSAPYRAELVTELKSLCDRSKSPLADVRVAALPAYVRWAGADARGAVLDAVRSDDTDERRAAIQLLPRWPDAEVARAVASRVGRVNETTYAKRALVEIGGPVAEAAVIPLLRSDDRSVRFDAMELLGQVGGKEAAKALRDVVKYSSDDALIREAEGKLLIIGRRLGQ